MWSRSRTLNPQPWPWPERPRVLVENPDDAAGLASASILRRAGYAVAVCCGPAERRRPPERCPLVGPDGCALVHGADVIVSSLGLERPEGRAVVQALRARYPETPLVVEVAPGEADRYRQALDGCDVIPSSVTPEQLLTAVRGALARRPGPAAPSV